MIICKDLIKIYQDEDRKTQVAALRGCDFTAKKGDIISIIGPSGSGKTTLINILAGLETISSGEVYVDNIDLKALNNNQLNNYRLKVIGLIDQFPEKTLFLESKVIDNLEFISNLSLGLSSRVQKNNYEILKKLGIEYLESRVIKTLSGGELTRVAIACALAKKPKLLLCDEPTGQLDSENTDKVKNLLKTIAEEFHTTILVVTHDVRFLEGIEITCEIRDGRISAILSEEDRKARSKFPISLKSSLDSTYSARIPDLIVESLQLENEIKYEISEEAQILLKNPQNITPKKIVLVKETDYKKTLNIKSLPKNHFKDKDLAIELKGIAKFYDIGKSKLKALSDIELKFEEIRTTYLNGDFISCIILCQTYLDSIFKNKFKMAGRNDFDNASFYNILKEAKENNVITEELYRLLNSLRKIRNKYVHLPLADDRKTIEFRQIGENQHYSQILQNDAEKAIKLFFLISPQIIL